AAIAAARPAAHPWKITAAPGRKNGQLRVFVAAGPVAWGGAYNAKWRGGEVGEIDPGDTRLVVWTTSQAAVPLAHDPRFPDGTAPECSCDDCDCMQQTGEPDSFSPGSGEVVLMEPPFERPEGATDCHIVGTVENQDGRAKIEQLLCSEITVRAIVRPDEEPEEPEEEEPAEEPPPCGNPLNGEGGGIEDNPLDDDEAEPDGKDGGGGKEKDDPTPEGSRKKNPLDEPGEGGYTPTCKEKSEDNAAAESDGKTEN
ncbi:MAG: hypothetical protein IJ678_03705, partial [Kiritimatiellae bacterium]|nr:hypothetical protein [Kiritimatiellia bacterium]